MAVASTSGWAAGFPNVIYFDSPDAAIHNARGTLTGYANNDPYQPEYLVRFGNKTAKLTVHFSWLTSAEISFYHNGHNTSCFGSINANGVGSMNCPAAVRSVRIRSGF